MATLFTADLHGNDTTIALLRGFKTKEEHDSWLIHCWNQQVNKNDLVYVLGDFCKGNHHEVRSFRMKLKGKIILILGNHDHCFSLETEILTTAGYKSFKYLKMGDIIPTINKEQNIIEMNPIENIMQAWVDQAYMFNGRSASGVFSKNHEHIILQNTYLKNKTEPIERKWVKLPSSTIWNYKSRLLMPASFISGQEDINISDNWLSFFGWLFSDGGFDKQGAITLYQSKPKNIPIIEHLLTQLKLTYTTTIRKNKTPNWYNNKLIKGNYPAFEFRIKSVIGKPILEQFSITHRHQLPSWFFNLSDRQVRLFLTSYKLGNGSKGNSPSECVWGTKELLSSLMGLCITHGIDCNLVEQNTRKGVYYLCLRNRPFVKNMQYKRNYGIREIPVTNRQIISYNNMMYDIEVKNHTFFIRHNGKSLITGNSNRIQNLPELFTGIYDIKEIKIRGFKTTLCHYSLRTWPSSNFNSFMLHGHSHGGLLPQGKQLDVDIGSNHGILYTEDDILAIMKLRGDNFNYIDKSITP